MYLTITVKPNANKTEILERDDENHIYKIAIAAVPDKGKANDELLKFLKKEFKQRFEIVSGETGRKKLIRTL